MFKNKRVFISGGSGVIGDILVRKLHEQGAAVFVGDLKPRPANWPAEIRYRHGDLNSIHPEELKAFAPEYFFHLAGTSPAAAEPYYFLEEHFHHNVRLGHHLLNCLQDVPSLKKVIFASGYQVYAPELYQSAQPSEIRSLNETDPVGPRNLAGMAMLGFESELRFVESFKQERYQTVSARVFEGIGLNSDDMISTWARSLIKGEEIVVPHKENSFDFIFAEDAAEGLIRLAGSGEAFGAVNLGSGKSGTVADVLQILKAHFPDMRYREAATADGSPFTAFQADMARCRQLTGWSPAHTLEMSIGKIVEFEKYSSANGPGKAMKPVNVLVTSISKKIPLLRCVRNAMEKAGPGAKLFGGDIDTSCIGRYFVDEFWKMPRLNDAAVDEILRYCIAQQIRIIIPSRDGELPFWAQHKARFAENGIVVMVASSAAIDNTLDKYHFYQESAKLGFPVITTALEPGSLQGESFVVKERFGAGARSIGLKLGRDEAANHGKKLEHPVFQPFISGVEYSVDVYLSQNGNFSAAICRTRDKVVDGESQITTTHDMPALENLSVAFVKALRLTGHSVLQVLLDGQQRLHIIECNARFGGASSLSVAAGLDSFYWLMQECVLGSDSALFFQKPALQLKQVRYPQDVIFFEHETSR